MSGHAFEARVYAERPEAGFLPGSGTLRHLRTPTEHGAHYISAAERATVGGNAVRLDTGVVEGDEISVLYDPMIAKLIVAGNSRESAIARMRGALSEVFVDGIKTNIPLHIDIFGDEAFRAGGTDIHYLERKLGID